MANLLSFIVKRLFASVVVVFIIITVVFFLAHSSPYDPIRLLLGKFAGGSQGELNVKRMRHLYGLDRPLHEQYLNYLGGLLHGNLGYSSQPDYAGTPVWAIIHAGVPVTLKLGAYALALSLFVGLPVGLISALRQNSFIDHAGQAIMIVLFVIPAFVLIPIAQLIFAVSLHWVPNTGWGDSGWSGPFGLIPNPGLSLKEMILPVSLYAAGISGFFAKSFRSFMLEVLRQDYIRTARAKGLKNRVIIYLHAFKNTLLPLASIVGPTIAFLIVGAFLVEDFFSIPGIANITVSSVLTADYAVIEATTILLVLFVILMNMLTDIFYAIIDPRVRL